MKDKPTVPIEDMLDDFKKRTQADAEKEARGDFSDASDIDDDVPDYTDADIPADSGQLDCMDDFSFDEKAAGENIKSTGHEVTTKKTTKDNRNNHHNDGDIKHFDKHTNEGEALFTNDFLLECLRARDKGNGILYSYLYGEKFAALAKDYWLEYNGHHWEECDFSRVQNSVEGVVNQYKILLDFVNSELQKMAALAVADDESKKIAKNFEDRKKIIKANINALHTVVGVNNCLTFSRANDKTTVISSDVLDAELHCLCCENGLIDLRTGELRPGTPKDYITKTCKGEWKGLDESAPLWEKMIHEILGEKEEVTHYFHKLIGMAMCGKISEKIFVILLGEDGDSGKTTIFETLFDVVRGYISPMPVEMLLDQRNPKNPDSPTPSIMSLRGKRLTWASEPGEHRRFSIENIKLMSGNDSLTGRNPWDKDMSSFTPTHTLFLLTNHKMRASAHDQAFWSRLRLIECPFNFVANPDQTNPRQRLRVDDLKQRIIDEEKSGILAWIVRGYMHYVAEGIEPPAEVKESTARYRREEDILEDFVEGCLEKIEVESSVSDAEKRIGASDLYELFKNWFTENYSKNVMSGTSFGRMAAKRIEKGKIGGKVYYFGYKITEDARGQYVNK